MSRYYTPASLVEGCFVVIEAPYISANPSEQFSHRGFAQETREQNSKPLFSCIGRKAGVFRVRRSKEGIRKLRTFVLPQYVASALHLQNLNVCRKALKSSMCIIATPFMKASREDAARSDHQSFRRHKQLDMVLKMEHGPKALHAVSEEQSYTGMYLRRAERLSIVCSCITASHTPRRNQEKGLRNVLRVARRAKREHMSFLPRHKLAEAFRT
jgi:hypothetical protein